MRKIFYLGLVGLALISLSGLVIAGSEEAEQYCEPIKFDPLYKGLFGLCNAYWTETDPETREDILLAFQSKAGDDGPGMPGLADVICPCWNYAGIVQEIACEDHDKGLVRTEEVNGTSYDLVVFENSASFWELGLCAGSGCLWNPQPSSCVFLLDGTFDNANATLEAELAVCRQNITDLIDFPPNLNPELYPELDLNNCP